MKKSIPTRDFAENENIFVNSRLCSIFLSLFADYTRMSLALFDELGEQISPLYGDTTFCEKILDQSPSHPIPKLCLKYHKELLSSCREKKKYRILKCPHGLYCFAFPILVEERLMGIIAGGHVLTGGQKEEMAHRLKSDLGDDGSLWEAYLAIPVMNRKFLEESVIRLANDSKICATEVYEKHLADRQLRKLIFASKMNEMVSTKLDIRKLLERTTHEVADAIDVDICLILLYDKERKDFNLVTTNLALPPGEAEMKFRPGEGITGIVALSGKSIAVPNALADPRVVKKSLGIKSLLAVPMKVGDETIGVLHVGSIKSFHEFTQRETEFVEVLASEAAIAVNNTKLYEESVKHTEELKRSKEELQAYFSQIGAALSSALNLHQILRLIMELSLKLIGAEAGSLYLIEDRKLSMHVSIGLDAEKAEFARFRMRESLLGWQEGNQNLTPPQTKEATEYFYQGPSSRDTIKSYLGVPLSIKDELIGLLNIYSRERKEFAPDKVELLSAFAGQAAMAIDNALSYEKEQKRAREATLLYEAARAIGQTTDLGELLEVTVSKISKIIQVDRCLIFLYDEMKEEFHTAANTGITDAQKEFFSFFRIAASDISREIWDDLESGKPRISSGIPPDCPGLARLQEIFPSNSYLLVPLIAREKLLGIIYVDDSQMAHYFSNSQIRLVMTLSIQIATALQRARLITKQEENTSQLKALLQVSSVLPSSLSLPKVFTLVVEKAAQLVNWSAVALLIMDDTENDFVLQESRGLNSLLLESALQKKISRNSIDKKRHTLLTVEDRSGDEISELLSKCNIGQVLSIPLIAKRRLVGILNCFSEEGHYFALEQVQLLRSFANHAAIAVENARLHNVVKNKVRELATLFEVGKAITSTLQFERVMEEVAKNVKRVMNADAVSIMFVDEEQEELSIHTALGLSKNAIERKIKIGEGVAGIAAKTGSPMILLDMQARKSPYKFPRAISEEGLRTILSVPLEAKGKITGLINIYLKDIYYYKPHEINLLVALSNSASMAIENAKLYEAQYTVAQLLQSIIMPQKEFSYPGIEVGYHYLSSLELSGDYFDLIPLSKTRFALVIADVSGKGPSAAIYTARAKYILKSYAIAGYQPREVLSMVNNLIIPEAGDDKFISLFYMEVDIKKKFIKFSSAGHEPPIYCSHATRELRLLETEGLLIGVSYDAKFRQEEITFENNDILVLYTDGITEARGGKGEIFGLERLMEIVKKHAHLDPQTIANRIYTAVQKYTRRKLSDDFSLLVVRL
ncbi:MAG: GAF domain-containing protein [Candidatus Eremiobacteraeota bacterium]|nr:GAF domain-containing protein [Candidatus Eremiobacteraeota bacterium]